MDSETFKRLGLDRLSPEAGRELGEWLNKVVQEAYNRGVSNRVERTGVAKGQEVIESRMMVILKVGTVRPYSSS